MSKERRYTIPSELFKGRPSTEKHTVEESPRVKEVTEELGKNIFGQDQAVHLLATRIAHNEHFDNKDQTKGNFFLYGPPGVGKTQLSIELAKFFHGDDWESHFTKLDGTDFKNQTSLGRLKGSDPNYVGYGDKLLISSDFLAKDNVVVVLDEIEKACPEFREYWLPVMDKGKAVAREGNKSYGSAKDTVMDYSNVWLISTSNVGSAEMNKSPIGIGTSSVNQSRQEKGQKAFRELFSVMPEWISRLGENNAVVLNTLQPEHYGMIINKFLGELNGTQKGRYNPVYVTETLLTQIYADANIEKYGARDIQHSIKRLVAPQISAVKDKHKPEEGLPILLHYDVDTKKIQTAIGDEPEPDPRLKKPTQPLKPQVSPAPLASVEKFYDAKRKMTAEEKFLWGATAATVFVAIAGLGRKNNPY
jgi:type VI secretion system protein VasG